MSEKATCVHGVDHECHCCRYHDHHVTPHVNCILR